VVEVGVLARDMDEAGIIQGGEGVLAVQLWKMQSISGIRGPSETTRFGGRGRGHLA
jgi:hypothetical protein